MQKKMYTQYIESIQPYLRRYKVYWASFMFQFLCKLWQNHTVLTVIFDQIHQFT